MGDAKWQEQSSLVAWAMFYVTYMTTSIALVRIFYNNLVSMSRYNTKSSQNVLGYEFNDAQRKMIKLSSKYLALFCVPSISSIIPILCVIIFRVYGGASTQIDLALFQIDVCINISCLLLQYAHMNAVYEKYCCFVYKCCKTMVTPRMKDEISEVLAKKSETKKLQDESSETSVEMIETNYENEFI